MARKLIAVLLGVAVLSGCPEDEQKDETNTAEKDTPKAGASTSATAESSANQKAKAPQEHGEMITIPSGKLRAGSACFDVPRIRPHELEHEMVSLGEFQIDKHPYPNKPGEKAKLNVTWSDAKKLCEDQGKRLCSEMEWERACKAENNKTYMWGNGFKKGQCNGQTDHMIGQREQCKTGFGVMDMMGISLEWTDSTWERGTPTGDRVVRGARAEKVSWLSARCTHSRKRDPNLTYDNLGFRCCKGDANPAKVVIEQRKRATVQEEPDIDTAFEMTLMKAMAKDHRQIPDVELSFDKVYRWHPVANEEMIIARWKGKPESGAPFYELAVFKLCGERAWNTSLNRHTMRGPVAKIGKPKVGINPRKLSFEVKTGNRTGEVKLGYWHGTVKVKQPDWIKKGNQLKVKGGRTLKLPKVKIPPKSN